MALTIEEFIRQRAPMYGVNPDIAVRVARSEGGLHDPFRRGMGPAPRSQAPGLGSTENSYGPFQLYVSGTGAGLGDRAMAAGIDPRKDWQAGVDYALKEASQKGWGQWYGAKNTGIGNWQGIGGDRAAYSPVPASSPYANMPDGPKGQESYPPPSAPFGSMAPPPAGPKMGPIPDFVTQAATANADPNANTLIGRLGGLAKAFDDAIPNAPRPSAFPGGPSAEQAMALQKVLQNPGAFAQALLKRRVI